MFKSLIEHPTFHHTGMDRKLTRVVVDNLLFLSDDNPSDKPYIDQAEQALKDVRSFEEFKNLDFTPLWKVKSDLKKSPIDIQLAGFQLPVMPVRPEYPDIVPEGLYDPTGWLNNHDDIPEAHEFNLAYDKYEVEMKAYNIAWYPLVRDYLTKEFGYRAIVFLKKDNYQTELIQRLEEPSRVVIVNKDHYEILTVDEYLDYKKVYNVLKFEKKLADFVEPSHNMYQRYLRYCQKYPCTMNNMQLFRPLNDNSSLKEYEKFAMSDETQVYNIFTDTYRDRSTHFQSSLHNYVAARHPGYVSGGMRSNTHAWKAYTQAEVNDVFGFVIDEEDYFKGDDPEFFDLDVVKCPHCGEYTKASLYTTTTTCYFCREEFNNPICLMDADPDWDGDHDVASDDYSDESTAEVDITPTVSYSMFDNMRVLSKKNNHPKGYGVFHLDRLEHGTVRQ